MAKTPKRRVAVFVALAAATFLSVRAMTPDESAAMPRREGEGKAGAIEKTTFVRRPIPVAPRREGRRLIWSDFLYPATNPESPLNFELDPFNATAELTASQQDDIIYAAQHPTPKPTEKSTWTKFWQIFF